MERYRFDCGDVCSRYVRLWKSYKWISSDDSVRLFIVDRDSDGLTVVKRFIITEELIKLSQEKHISLSRMWVDGYLGGVPNV